MTTHSKISRCISRHRFHTSFKIFPFFFSFGMVHSICTWTNIWIDDQDYFSRCSLAFDFYDNIKSSITTISNISEIHSVEQIFILQHFLVSDESSGRNFRSSSLCLLSIQYMKQKYIRVYNNHYIYNITDIKTLSRPRTPAARGCLLHTCYSGSQRRNRQ